MGIGFGYIQSRNGSHWGTCRIPSRLICGFNPGIGTFEYLPRAAYIMPSALQPLIFSMGNMVIQKQVLAVGALLALLSGCDSRIDEMAVSATAELPNPKEISAHAPPFLLGKSSALHGLVAGEKVYKNTCSICHRLGLRGAPRLGDKEDWVLRLARGNEILYDHAVKGYRGSKGSMPSRGSNAKLSENEVKAAVDYMVWHSMPKSYGSLRPPGFSAAAKPSTIR